MSQRKSMFYSCLNRGCPPLKPRLTFCLETKSKQKVQDCARFARKTYVQLAKTVQTHSFVAQTGQFFNANFTCFSAHQTRSILAAKVLSSLSVFVLSPIVATSFVVKLNLYARSKYMTKIICHSVNRCFIVV